MDNNGNPTEGAGGGGSVPDDIDINSVCAVSGTFQNLGVGSCGLPAYEFPTTAKGAGQSKGIIVSQGGTVELVDIVSNRFTITYGIGLSGFVRTLILTAQEYELQDLLSQLITIINNQIATDTGTNTVSLTLGGDGKINFSINDGNVKDFSISDDSGFGLLGNTDNSNFPTPNLRVFANEPTYSDTTNYTTWSTYRFDDNGNVYSGDMTITGSLSVSTIISDIEVEDAIITLNKNGVADNNTSGVVLNNSTNTKFSGLLKKDNSDDFYLFANSETLPTESGWTPVDSGNLFLKNINVNTPTGTGTVSIFGDNPAEPAIKVDVPPTQTAKIQEWRADGLLQASMDAGGQLDAKVVDSTQGNFTILKNGALTNDFFFPNARGLAGQVITATGTGESSAWLDPAIPTLLKSPDTLTNLTVADDLITAEVAGQNRLVMDATGSTLIDPTGQARLKDEATLTTLTNATGGTFFELGDTTSRLSFGGVDALSLLPLVTTIRGGPSGFSELQLGGPVFGLDYRYGSQQRIKISGPASQIFSPDGQGEFDIRNDRALTVVNGITRQELTPSITTIRDENNIERIVADSGSTRLNAPTGSNKLTVSSSALQSDGPFVVQTTDPAQVQIRSNAPLGQVVSLQQWQVNFATVAQIDQQGNGAFNNNFLITNDPGGSVISNLSSVPLNVGPSTHSKLNIGYSGAPTTINGAVDVPNGLTIGAPPNKYAFPLVAGAEGQHLEVNATGDLAYTYGQIFASVQANATTAMTLALQNTYYPLPNATTSTQLGGFTFGALGLVTYNGAYPLFLRVGAHCSIERTSGGGADVFSFSILKNGAVSAGIGESRAKFDDNGNFPLEVSFEGVVVVANGDTLQLAVANEDAAATTANVYSYSFVISKI